MTFRSGVSATEGGVSVGGKGYSVGQEKDLMGRLEEDPKAVSYTHLTLPTIYSV